MSDSSSSSDESGTQKKRIKSTYDLQREQLEQLMKNPTQEVEIPKIPKDEEELPREFRTHEFVRNVMGASAGAGSGEFDIYRGCRRRELARQEYLQSILEKEQIAKEFEEKRLKNLQEAEAKTAKKRAKRLKQKSKQKAKKNNSKGDEKESSDEETKNEEPEEVVEIDLDAKEENQLNQDKSATTAQAV